MIRFIKVIIFVAIICFPCLGVARNGTPRLYLTPDLLSKLQAKVVANDATWLAIKESANTYTARPVHSYDTARHTGEIMYTYQGEGWLEAAEPLALAWKLTGDTKYADKLIQLADVMIAADITVVAVDNAFPTRSVPYIAALIYDWLYDYSALNQNGRKAALISKVNAWFDYYKASAYEKSGPSLSNYFGGHLLGFGTAGMAMDDDNDSSHKMLPYMKNLWDATVGVDFGSGGVQSSGWPQQGFNYGPGHFIRLFKFAQAYKAYTEVTTGTGIDLLGSSVYTGMALNHIYNLLPNRWQATDEGDWPNATYKAVMSAEVPAALTGLLAGTLGDQMAYFINHLSAGPGGSASVASTFTNALFNDTSRTQTDYRTVQPLAYHSVPDQHVYVRSDWTDNAVWSSYNGGSWNWPDHQVMAAGHVALVRGSDVLLANASQWKGDNGINGSPDVDLWYSQGTNTLFFQDGGVYGYYPTTSSNPVYEGGQAFYGVNTNLKYEAGAGYVYSKNDHTTAYSVSTGYRPYADRTLRLFHRNYLNLGGNTIVVFDRIQASDASYTKELRFHLHKQSTNTNTGGVIQSAVGSSRVFIKPIFPASGMLTLDTSDMASALPRVRITPPAGLTDWTPLTVISTGSSSASAPATTTIDTASMLGVETGGKVAMFSKDGTERDAVAYSTSATADSLLVDMEPGVYTVTKDGIAVGDFTASSQGVLSFSTVGGGDIVATLSGSSPGGGLTNNHITFKAGNTHVTRKSGNTAVTIQ
ncbi:MAG: hypothetical protein RBR35_17235 [Salinivirgaceae bacterium]|nr:hypothetical protein [Salinivirgaceae bacterium]